MGHDMKNCLNELSLTSGIHIYMHSKSQYPVHNASWNNHFILLKCHGQLSLLSVAISSHSATDREPVDQQETEEIRVSTQIRVLILDKILLI